MNLFTFSGALTSDATLMEDDGQGAKCSFHVNVGPQWGKNPLWIQCFIRGKLAEDLIDDLTKGQIVTGHGWIVGCTGGPIYVQVRTLIPHAGSIVQVGGE